MTRENLSDELPEDIKTVIHAAASVKHYGNYEYFHAINTLGTQYVAEFALRQHARMIHISTGSVSGNSMADDFSVYRSPEEKYFDETSLYIGQPLTNVYIRSKFEAERRVLDAMLSGLDAVIVRVGNLTNRYSDLCFQPNYLENAFLTRVKAMLEFGMLPDYLLPLYAEFSPVDLTADGVLRIAQYASEQTVFHLHSDKPLHFTRLLELLREIGIRMDVVSGEAFSQALKETMRSTQTEYIYEAFQRDMDENDKLVYETNIHIGNEFTHWFMKRVGFVWNEMDLRYLKAYIEYFRKLGYFLPDGGCP